MNTKTLAQETVPVKSDTLKPVKRITIEYPIELWRAARKFTAPPLEEGPSFKALALEGLQLAIEKHEAEAAAKSAPKKKSA